jgi:hypothetical protein
MEWTGHQTREVFDRYTSSRPGARRDESRGGQRREHHATGTERLGGALEVGDSVTFLATIQRMQYHPLMFRAINVSGGVRVDALS